MIEKIETLYSPGSAKYPEDALITSFPFLGVIDAYSTPYATKPMLYSDLTDGQMVCKAIVEGFNSFVQRISLEKAVLIANKRVAVIKKSLLKESSAGAAFCFVKIEEEKTTILQGADCLALWIKKSKEINIIGGEYCSSSLESRGIFKKLMEKHQDRKKAWEEFCPILGTHRKESANIKYAVIDGQEGIKNCWKKIEIPTSELKLLICFTDGMKIPGKQGNELIQEMLKFLQQGGIQTVLQEVRKQEKEQAAYSHKDYGEATALIITF